MVRPPPRGLEGEPGWLTQQVSYRCSVCDCVLVRAVRSPGRPPPRSPEVRSVPGQARTKQQLAAEVMASIIRLNKERIRANGAYLRPHDLTTQQVWLLAELPKEGGAPIGSLADVMQCHSSNVTGMVDRLEPPEVPGDSRRSAPVDREDRQLKA